MKTTPDPTQPTRSGNQLKSKFRAGLSPLRRFCVRSRMNFLTAAIGHLKSRDFFPKSLVNGKKYIGNGKFENAM